jgi:hypothetical protein
MQVPRCPSRKATKKFWVPAGIRRVELAACIPGPGVVRQTKRQVG